MNAQMRAAKIRVEYHCYDFVKTQIAGIPVVYVKKRGGNSNYTVNLNRNHCDCPDHQIRRKGNGEVCKHVMFALRFVKEQEEAKRIRRASWEKCWDNG